MVRPADKNLARFAAHAGFQVELLAARDPNAIEHGYTIEHAPADFTGRVEALRITAYGRLGNVFYQTLHAVLLARLLGCHTILTSPNTMPQPQPSIEVDGVRMVFRVEPGMDRIAVPTLVGNFFTIGPFESALRALPPTTVLDAVHRFLKPLFADVLAMAAPVGNRTLVMSFRSGDVFSEAAAHSFYVQPPASYYLRALAYARERLGVTDVRLVSEDDANTAIALVQTHMRERGIPFAAQSASVTEDLACLCGASHPVAPYSTFIEAAAMLSCHLKTYFAFRSFESHQPQQRRQCPLLLGLLRHKDVDCVLIHDAAGDYIPPLRWDCSPRQLRLVAEFPIENLAVLEGEAAEAWEVGLAEDEMRADLLAATREAARLRGILLAGHAETLAARGHERALRQQVESLSQEIAALTDHLDATRRREADGQASIDRLQGTLRDLDAAILASTSWRVTAPLRWLARTLRGTR